VIRCPQRTISGSSQSPRRDLPLVVCLWVLLLLAPAALAQPSPSLAPSTLVPLQEALARSATERSSVAARRSYKRVIREAQAILEASPTAPNRYEALAIVFQAEKRLLSLESNERNRAAIFETCRKLAEAPDDYAELRFDADMLLSERNLAERDATLEQRAAALRVMLDRYRGTSAEWRSLMVGSLIAPKLLAFDLEQDIKSRIAERFGADHKAIEFRHQQTNVGELDVVFSGRYERLSGGPLVFPYDRLGHQYLVLFWSKSSPDYLQFLDKVKEQVARFPQRFEVYSLNVDELPDAGKHILDDVQLDATALRLPGGRSHSAYRAYARMDPVALLVNGQGHIHLKPGESIPWPGATPARGKRPASIGPGIGLYLDDDRYLAQLRSLYIGDFLIRSSGPYDPQLAGELAAIDACFTPAPLRFRLTRDQSLANYRKAEALCSAAIDARAPSPGGWELHNRRIIARLGLWNLAAAPEHLQAAADEAQQVLASTPPAGADVVARFCLALRTLRSGGADPEKLAAQLIRETGSDNAPASALAAATILSLHANARTPFQKYRAQLLGKADGDGEPNLRPVYAFLRDKHHRYRNFWATPGGYGYGRPQKYQFRFMVGGYSPPAHDDRRLQCELKTPDGQTLTIADIAAGKMLGIVFVEPPADQEAGRQVMQEAAGYAASFADEGVAAIVVFLADDPAAVKSLLEGREVDFQVGLLPNGLAHPLVQRMGILSADRTANLCLLRPDGTIAWSISGLRYHAFGHPGHAMRLAITSNIEKVRSDRAFDALERGAFAKALTLFAQRLPPARNHDCWTADRLHGRALASMGLRDWASALVAIDAAIKQRQTDFKGGICKCHGVVEMHLTKAMILDRLDRGHEAADQRRLAAEQNIPHAALPPGVARQGVPVGVYYDWLKRIRLRLEEGGQVQ
jgi:hypothetical protein